MAVTFTTRAAGELRGRLQQLGVPRVQARTFHSAALRQAQYFWPHVHGGELPSVLDNRMSLVAESAHRLRISVDTAKLRDLFSEISWAKVSNTTPEDYPRIAAASNRQIASVDSETIARVFAGYEAAKRDRGRIDFEDILLCAAGLLSEHAEIRSEVQRTYRHLVVDEYQDVSPLQQALLDLWAGDRSDLCVVGDPAQTIHSFAGARASYLTGFASRHPKASVIRLVRDYRSTPQVVRSANAIMQDCSRRRADRRHPAGSAADRSGSDGGRGAGRGERGGGRGRLARRAGHRRGAVPRDGGAVPDQRPIAVGGAGVGGPQDPVPGPRRRAVLRATRGPPGPARPPDAGSGR